jgi:phosphate:Na+ symporter
MKDGFETMKDGLDLAKYAMSGYMGVFVYIAFGAAATVIIQSSSATMAIIITALATGQIDYINALSLAIGANIGTTVTAAIGAMASNKNGKRLAVAHLIFNMITGLVAVIFIYQLRDLVNITAPMLGISENDDAMKLSLFHTIFNVVGVLLVSQFTNQLGNFLETLFQEKEAGRGQPKYLTAEVMEVPATAIAAIRKETIHLYDKSLEAILHAMNLHRTDVCSDAEVEQVIKRSNKPIPVNIDEVYQKDIKNLYGEILNYASMTQSNMDQIAQNKIYDLKLTARYIIEMVKDIRELQKNLNHFRKSRNAFIIEEYNDLRAHLMTVLRTIQRIRESEDGPEEIMTVLEVQKTESANNEVRMNSMIDTLIREHKIDPKMASSLINDIGFTHSICRKLLNAAAVLWVNDEEVQELGDEYELE